MIEPVEKIDQKELQTLLGKGRTAIWRLRDKDKTFPKPIDQQPLRWVKSQVLKWVDSHDKTQCLPS